MVTLFKLFNYFNFSKRCAFKMNLDKYAIGVLLVGVVLLIAEFLLVFAGSGLLGGIVNLIVTVIEGGVAIFAILLIIMGLLMLLV